MAEFKLPVVKVESLFLKKTAHLSKDDQAKLKRAILIKLALHLPNYLAKMDLPKSILALYPDAFKRLVDFLKSVGDQPYDSTGEFFCKDLRFVLGLSIYNGASSFFDVFSRVPVSSAIISFCRSRNVDAIIRYVRARGSRPWVRGHLDSRFIKEYNQQVSDTTYCRLAEFVERKKEIAGYVGTTWFFDPKVAEVSPRLAWLQDLPRERGAFFLQHGADTTDINFAMKMSESRRRLYKDGKYIPKVYSMLWPREELISWARKYRASLSHD
ncbi:MAG: hypothetical protein CVU54_18800 [Deltaproteobacteria bacterium HGW-Deltaproteobacteria-12]|nr:MAG: hypothetical protein CVU54_18800 [Deltaproteobacteria bacterium HGW-Deltaproteobacteria-12]